MPAIRTIPISIYEIVVSRLLTLTLSRQCQFYYCFFLFRNYWYLSTLFSIEVAFQQADLVYYDFNKFYGIFIVFLESKYSTSELQSIIWVLSSRLVSNLKQNRQTASKIYGIFTFIQIHLLAVASMSNCLIRGFMGFSIVYFDLIDLPVYLVGQLWELHIQF